MREDTKAMFVGGVAGFTIGKYYPVLEQNGDFYFDSYKVTDDKGITRWLNNNFFCKGFPGVNLQNSEDGEVPYIKIKAECVGCPPWGFTAGKYYTILEETVKFNPDNFSLAILYKIKSDNDFTSWHGSHLFRRIAEEYISDCDSYLVEEMVPNIKSQAAKQDAKENKKAKFIGPEMTGFTIDNNYTIFEEKFEYNNQPPYMRATFVAPTLLCKTTDNDGNIRWINSNFFFEIPKMSKSCVYEDEVVPDVRSQADKQGVKFGIGMDFNSICTLAGVKESKNCNIK